MSKKITFRSSNITAEQRKKLFLEEHPEFADHPFWGEDDGMPHTDPAILATFTEPAYDFDEENDD